MRGVGKKNNNTRSVVIFFLLLFLFLLITNSTYKVYKKNKIAEIALNKMYTEISDLENNIIVLNKTEERLNNNEGIEYELRKRFSVASIGESLAVIVDEDKGNFIDSPHVSLWSKLKSFLDFIF